MSNKNKGVAGEELATSFLKTKGYRILAKNFRTDAGEIDVIVTDERTLIFVEVKARFSADFGYPSEAVTYHKRIKINQVASQYIKKFDLYDVPVRFDVVEVYLDTKDINHIENAFDSYLRY